MWIRTFLTRLTTTSNSVFTRNKTSLIERLIERRNTIDVFVVTFNGRFSVIFDCCLAIKNEFIHKTFVFKCLSYRINDIRWRIIDNLNKLDMNLNFAFFSKFSYMIEYVTVVVEHTNEIYMQWVKENKTHYRSIECKHKLWIRSISLTAWSSLCTVAWRLVNNERFCRRENSNEEIQRNLTFTSTCLTSRNRCNGRRFSIRSKFSIVSYWFRA